jgi:hypothetical protein
LRQLYRSTPEPFDARYYDQRYTQAQASHDAEKKAEERLEAELAKIRASFGPARPARPNYPSTPPVAHQSHTTRSGPFPPGNRKDSTTSCCLLCVEGGHGLSKHHGPPKSVTFADGRPTWANVNGKDLLSPAKQQICIAFNLRGSRSTCAGSSCERVHVCSWCGSSAHHAFSWSCRARPTA